MTIYINQHGFREGVSHHDALVAIAQHQARVSLDSVTDLTNSVGGSASGTYTLAAVSADAVNAAASGSDLADKATTESALGTVRDGFKELVAKYNSAAAKLGLATITDSLGGTAADGTVGAVTVSVTGAATGAQATDLNTVLSALNTAQAVAAAAVNRVAVAAGTQKVTVPAAASATLVSTLPALTIGVGTAAAPGVKKAVVDAKLTDYRTNLNTLVTALNLAFAGAGNVPVVAV